MNVNRSHRHGPPAMHIGRKVTTPGYVIIISRCGGSYNCTDDWGKVTCKRCLRMGRRPPDKGQINA